MDWMWWTGLVLFVVAAGIAAFYLFMWVSRTREEFRANLPDLRITNLSAMVSGDVLTLSPEFENLGGGVALDCQLHMGGWEGSFAVKKVFPRGPRHQRHVASIVLGPDAPVRATSITNGYLRVRFLDRWGNKYDRWYTVTQTKKPGFPLFDVHIDLDHPDVNDPAPSFWEMRTFLRTITLQDQEGQA